MKDALKFENRSNGRGSDCGEDYTYQIVDSMTVGSKDGKLSISTMHSSMYTVSCGITLDINQVKQLKEFIDSFVADNQ